jgi:flagellar hook-length control protein FliK
MSAVSMPAPVARAVTPAGAPRAGDAGAESAEFASLMAGLLGEGAAADTGLVPADAAGDPAGDPAAAPTGNAAPDSPGDPTGDPTGDAALALLAAAAGQVVTAAAGTVDTKVPRVPAAAVPQGHPVVQGQPGPQSEGQVPYVHGSAPGSTSTVQALPGQALPGQAPVAGTGPVAAVAGPATATAPGTTGPVALPAEPGVTAATGEAASAEVTAALAGAARSADQAPAPAAALQPGVQAAPVSAQAPTALAAPPAVAPVHAGPLHVPDQVTAQVFPEIGRLAVRASSAGEGVHRITLNLHPETLGDVRVTLVVRGGEMKVSIHAATEAGRIMADSLPELRRLLASAGAGDATLAVRDTSANGAAMTSADQGSDRSGPGRTGYDAQQGHETHDQGARMRDGHHATDGSNRGPRGALPGPHDQARATRPAGVDVTV